MSIIINNNTTLEDLANLANVSTSTVSRALRDHPLISMRTKQRIWALAREHNYPFRPDMPSSPIGAVGSITIVTPNTKGGALPLSHPFFLELLADIGEAARSRGCDFTVSHLSPTNYEDLMHSVTTGKADGVIFLGQSTLHDSLNRLAESKARFVVWGAEMPQQQYCSVGTDNQLGGRRATLHLARLGRKSIVFLGGADLESVQRRQGYREGLAASGLQFDPKLAPIVEFGFEAAEAAVNRLIREAVRVDGIVAASDLIALGAIRALKRFGISVPEEVSVTGYDDMLLSKLSTPSLTTIKQNTFEAGRILVSRILDDYNNKSPVRLSTDLIVRESCGA